MSFDIPANRSMLDLILADARANAGPLAPSVWPLEVKTETLADMMPGLVGDVGIQPVDHDALYFFRPYSEGVADGPKFRLGTLMDVALISEAHRVCEVGGGHGRLAEAYLQRDIHYVLVDAVPAVLMYAYEYLKREFPDKRIGSYYADDVYGPEWDCYILPAWRTDVLPSETFDTAVNIESMQEMNAEQVAFFFALFDRLLTENGRCYISNARDYKYIGPWPAPKHWEIIYQHNTPRSWTPNHPTIIYRKGTVDYSEANDDQEHAFTEEIARWDSRLPSLTMDHERPRMIRFSTASDFTGDLTPAIAPFPVRNVFWLHNVPGGARRGGHSHKVLREVVVAVSGSFDVVTVTESGRKRWSLNRADRGVFLPPGAWRHLDNFSSNAVALVLASTEYDPTDYITDFGDFLATLPASGEDWFSKRRFQEVEAWQKTR